MSSDKQTEATEVEIEEKSLLSITSKKSGTSDIQSQALTKTNDSRGALNAEGNSSPLR